MDSDSDFQAGQGVPGLGRAIRRLRTAAGYSQDRLARRANVSTPVVLKAEQGKSDDMRLSNAVALARALEVTVDRLVEEAARCAAAGPGEEDEQPKPRRGRPGSKPSPKKGGGK